MPVFEVEDDAVADTLAELDESEAFKPWEETWVAVELVFSTAELLTRSLVADVVVRAPLFTFETDVGTETTVDDTAVDETAVDETTAELDAPADEVLGRHEERPTDERATTASRATTGSRAT